MITLQLPWPPKVLSPNSRPPHWAVLSRAKRLYRAACALEARRQGVGSLSAEKLAIGLVFVPPDKRHRDADNCLAAIKSGLDGLADVLKVDDNRWRISFEVAQNEVGGFVRVSVTDGGAS